MLGRGPSPVRLRPGPGTGRAQGWAPGPGPGWLLLSLALVLHVDASQVQFCSSVEISEYSAPPGNCTTIQGSLTLRNVHLSAFSAYTVALQHLREVSDYVVLHNVSGVASLATLLPRLAVIRGEHLFAKRYALAVIGTELVDLALPSLVLLQNGAVTVFDNVQLCVYTVDWRVPFNRSGVKLATESYRAVEVDVYLHNNAPRSLCISKRDCPSECPRQADWKRLRDRSFLLRDVRRTDETQACWSSQVCHKECPKECTFACEYDLARRGAVANASCCHPECLGGCQGDGPDSCSVCRNVWHAGRCLSHCPSGTLRLLHRCITLQECTEMISELTGANYVVHEGQCVETCPADTRSVGQVCQPCVSGGDGSTGRALESWSPSENGLESECVKVCPGGAISSLAEAQSMANCNVINGSLTIRMGYDSVSIMSPDAFSVQKELKANLRRLRVIRGRLRVIRSHILTSLDFLSNLRLVEGLQLDESTPSEYSVSVIDNENLEMIWSASNESHPLQVRRGRVIFQMNANLCPDKLVAFQREANLSELVALETNGLGRTCRAVDAEDGIALWIQSVKPTSVMLAWNRTSPSNLLVSDYRFLSYVVYYKQYAFQNLTEADYAHTTQSTLLDTASSNVKAWSSLLAGNSNHFRVTDLSPYTQYAFYVLRLASSREWTRVSDFVYERTKPTRPSRPRILNDPEQSVNDASDSITVNIRWLEPAQPNGIINFYLIHVENPKMGDASKIVSTQCASRSMDTVINRAAATVNQSHDTVSDIALQCDRYEEQNCAVNRAVAEKLYSDLQSLRLSPVRVSTVQQTSLEAQQVSARYDEFDDMLSTDMMELHLTQDRTQDKDLPDVQSASRRNDDDLMAVIENIIRQEFVGNNRNNAVDDDNTVANDKDEKEKAVATDLFLEKLENPDEFRGLIKTGRLFVHDNPKQLWFTLRDLQIYSKYTIRIYACHNYSKLSVLLSEPSTASPTSNLSTSSSNEVDTVAKTDRVSNSTIAAPPQGSNEATFSELCSKPATLADEFTTRGVAERDTVEKANVTLSRLDSDYNIRIIWRPPKRPNGFVLFYELEIRSSPTSTPQHLCHPATREVAWESLDVRLAHCGDFAFRIRAVSLWGPGYWTELEPYNITCDVHTATPPLTYVLSVVLPLLAVVLTVALVSQKVCKARKSPIPVVNPVYDDIFYKADEWEVQRERVNMARKLGGGTFGEVYEGMLLNDSHNGTPVAIKTVRGVSPRDCMSFLEEASIMKEFTDCFHIVKLLGIVSIGQPVMVIMELMSHGDLKTFLRRHRTDADDPIGRPPPSFAYLFEAAAQIADGMAYLGGKKYVHRDLAARNILVSEDFVVKIGDFGLTRDVYESDYYRKEQRGPLPIRWMAPESLADGLFDARTDVWSYGVVLWEMATLGEQPYQGLSNEMVLKHVRDGNTLPQPDGCDDEFFGIIQRCWARRPASRPSFIAILQFLEPHFGYSFTTVSWYHNRYLTNQTANNRTTAQVVVHS